MKLVAGAGKPSEPHSLEAMVDFEMRKTHLNALALVTRLEETVGSHQPACQIAFILCGHHEEFAVPECWDNTAS